MELTALQILTLSLCAIGLAACFVPRISAALIAYGALICAHCYHFYRGAGEVVSTQALIFWGVATGIILALRWLNGEDSYNSRSARAYTAGGAVMGAFVGILIHTTSGGAVLGSIVGAILGAIAYMRTPGSPHLTLSSGEFIQFLCARGLPVVVACSIIAITTVVVLQ